MVGEWNKNMAEQFTPSWVSCLDESMTHGQASIHAQDGCLCLESHINLVMNTIQFVAPCQVLCGGWSL